MSNITQVEYRNIKEGPKDENYSWKHDTDEGNSGCYHIIPTTEHMFKGKLNILRQSIVSDRRRPFITCLKVLHCRKKNALKRVVQNV